MDNMKTVTPQKRKKEGAKRSNIYDVAKAAGVSIATISRAMNNRSIVSADTFKQIETAMKRLNYRPNPNAKSLAEQKSNQIAVLLPPHDEIHLSQVVMAMLVGVIRGAEKYRLGVMIHMLVQTDVGGNLWYNAAALEGAVVLNDVKKMSVIREFERNRVPMIYINCTDDRKKHRVTVDDRLGARLATEYLIQLGHERIALLTGELNILSGLSRMRGCEDALRQHNLLKSCESCGFIRNTRFDQRIAYRETLDLLSQSHRPTAIFAASDWMALGALTAIRERGLRVPQDISIIGYDNSILASQVSPALTTVHQPFIEMGHEAVEGIVKIHEESAGVYHKLLQPSLIERESCAAPSGAPSK